MPATFDPEAFLAEPAAPAFDPNAFLAEPASAFDPAAFLAESQAEPLSEPTQNYFVDKAKRVGRSLAQVPGQFVESVGQMADATGRALAVIGADELNALQDSPTDARLAAFNQALRTPTPGTALIRDTGREMRQNARDLYKGNYAPDPARDAELGADVAGATGSLAAALITPGGLITKTATGALFTSLGQSDEARQKMLERGATEKEADDEGLRQFVLNLPAGGLEAIPWGTAIKRFGGGKIADAVSQKYGKNALRRISTAVFGQAATEAGEEALQNLWGNAAAKLTYDPTRGWTEGTGRAALVGGVMGGGFGGTLQTTAEIASALNARGQRLPDQMPAAPVPAAQADLDEALARQAVPPEAPVPEAAVPTAQTDLEAALARQAPPPAAPVPPTAPAQVAPPEPASAPVDNAPVGATPANVPGTPADEFGALHGPKLSPDTAQKFRDTEFQQDLGTTDGIEYKIETRGNKLWLTASKVAIKGRGADYVELGIAYLQVDQAGNTILGGSFANPLMKDSPLAIGAKTKMIAFINDMAATSLPEPAPLAPAPFDPVAFIAAPEPVQVPPDVLNLNRAEPTFTDLISGFVETPDAVLYMRERKRTSELRWANLSAPERAAAHAEFGTENQVQIERGTFPFDVTPSRFAEVVASIESARAPVAQAAAPAPEIPLEQQLTAAELADSRASTRFREAGKWNELKGQPARQRWQALKAEKLTAERALDEIRAKVKDTAPAPAEVPVAPVVPAAPAAPAGGKVAATADRTVITPIGTQQAKVVKLATKKQLQVQREFLEEALRNAATVAEPNQQQPNSSPKFVIISVPGDGTFSVANDRKALLAMAETVKKHFGKGLDWVGISKPPSEARGMASLGKKLAPDKVTKIVAGFVSTDDARSVLQNVYQDGIWTVATDGISLFFTKGGAGKTAAQFDKESLGQYPDWQALLPREGQGMKISGDKMRPGGKPVGLDTAGAIKKLTSGIAALGAGQVRGQIHLGPKGEFGVSVVKEGNGVDYVSDGVTAGQPSVGAVDLFRLRDVLEALRRLGHVTVGLQTPEAVAPTAAGKGSAFVLTAGDSAAALVMESALKLRAAAPDLDAEIDRPVDELEVARARLGAEQNALAEAVELARKVQVSPERFAFIEAGINKTLARIKELESKAAPAPAETPAETPPRRGSSAGANASPGFAAAPPMGAVPGGPPKGEPAAPADDPAFTELPIELPEAVQFFKLLTGGQYAHIRERIRALAGQAAGVFRYREGDLTSGEIELRADLFNLLSLDEKQELLRQAVAWANAMRQGDSTLNEKDLIRSKFEELVRDAERASVAAGPRRALATFWHEIGHFLDFYPQATTKRGNILGRLASLNRYFKKFLAKSPGLNAEPPTSDERAAFRRQAERELTESVSSIVETIRREEPVYREIPITAETITGIVKMLARDEFPEFYDWFAKLDRANKAGVLRAAMKGIVDERAAKFGRRELTGEVKVVEETVTRVTGTPPTAENIRARYEELLRAELESRGLINEKDIRKELEGAIAWWRGTKTVPEYFKPSVELWADTMSIFFNNPAALAKRAPKFYEAFMRWMAVKPGIREEYDKIQHAIKSGQIYRDRVTNLREMFVRDDKAGAHNDEFATRIGLKQDIDTARLLFDRQFAPIESRIGRNPTDPQGQRALSALGNYRYRATAWEAFAQAMRNEVEVPLAAANLTHLDMAEYMFHRRITDGLYRNLAAPLGWNPKNSGERLAEMERDLGPARWQSLVAAQVALRGIYEKRVLKLLRESGIMSPELAAAVDRELFYAPFNKARVFEDKSLDLIADLVKEHYGEEAAGQIYGAVGNLGEIRSPYVQLMHRAMGLISMAYRQLALKRVVDWMREHEPLAVSTAPMLWNGKRLAPVRKETPRVSTFYLLNRGKVEGVYVPKVIGEMFASGGEMETRAIGFAHSILGPPKMLLTELNPGFWPVAFIKDVWSATNLISGGGRILANLPRSYLAAYRTFYGKPDPLAQQVLDRMMVISRADSRGEHLGQADEMTRILLRLGKSPVQWGAEVGRVEQVMRVLWRGWAQQGQIFERTVKIAAMQAIDRAFPAMPEWRKRELVRERGGSPDFLAKGRWAFVVEVGLDLMFFNAFKEGVRSTYHAAADDPRGFWLKFAATAGAAGLLMWAIEEGLKGDAEGELRDMFRSIPERDKLRGLVLPLWWNDKAAHKVLYLMLPFPDSIRWAHALQRKALQSSVGNSSRSEGLSSALSYQGQDLPGGNPWRASARELWDYNVKGLNPPDEFTGRGALDQTRVDAEQAGGELAKRTISNLTGGMLYKYRSERPGETTTKMEDFLRAPVVSNLLGRWLRVSNRGLDELYRKSTEGDVREQARLKLVGEEMISRTLKGEPWAKEHLALVGTSEYLANYINDAGPRLMMQADSPYLRALTQAKTNAEKLSIWKMENELNQAKVKRLDRLIGTPPPPP